MQERSGALERTDLGPKGLRTERSLKDAARRVFARDGYVNAKITDIAVEAGKSPASFYNYFQNKRQILEALLDDFMEALNDRTLLLTQPGTARYESLRAAVQAFWQTYQDFLPELVGVTQAAAVDEDFMRVWLRVRELGVQNIARAVAAAQRNGRLPARLDAMMAASALSSMLEHSCYLWLGMGVATLGRPSTDETAIETIATLWYRALWSPDEAGAGD
ncbi:TetR/AcrR family transcriptional regulator [Microbispora sp. CA-102843]|uniref:TetR/AcrR family transcriptional regulator n=1 Tax=Microbispora sp. CA-102843 TaxID=3239952 RepID=UPI003D937191